MRKKTPVTPLLKDCKAITELDFPTFLTTTQFVTTESPQTEVVSGCGFDYMQLSIRTSGKMKGRWPEIVKTLISRSVTAPPTCSHLPLSLWHLVLSRTS